MKRILLLIILSAFYSTVTIAQQMAGTIIGNIYDSINDIPLTSASVVIYKQSDSTLVNFQITNYRGEFNITKLPTKTPLYLKVNFTGYITYTDNIKLDSTHEVMDLKRIILFPKDSSQLSDVIVESVAPIKMNGDTLEINPDAFKLDSNAVVEEMLLRVPGMVVWSDGKITMNGKTVEKLLVDGKPFFGGETKIATQNLPKDAIQKIQLYQEKDPTKIPGVDDDTKKDSIYSMNIKLKEDKKSGLFGKITAGYGTDKRYDANGVIQAYNPKNQLGIAIGLDNTNKTKGIGTDAFLANTFKQSFVHYGYSDPNVSGVKKNLWGSAKFQHTFNETDNGRFFNRMTGDYSYTNTNLNNINNTDKTENLIDYKLHSISNSNSENSNRTHKATLLYERRKKYGDFINISTSFNHSDQENNNSSINNVFRNDTAISNNNVVNKENRKNTSIGIHGFISSNDYQNKRSPLKNYFLSFNVNYNDNKSLRNTVNNFQSFVDSIPSNTIIRNYDNKSSNFSSGANLRYNGFKQLLMGIYNFYNIDVSLNNKINVSRSTQNNQVRDYDENSNEYISNEYLTNNNTLNNLAYSPGLSFSKSFNKNVYGNYYYYLHINASANYSWINQKNISSLLYRNITRNYQLWEPDLSINFNQQKFNHYKIYARISGRINPQTPDIDQLVPIIDTSNRYNVTAGNPNLKIGNNKSVNFNVEINRSNQKAKSGYGISVYGAYNTTSNAVADSIVYDESGKSIRYLLNMNGANNFNLNANINFSTKFNKKYQLQTKYTPSFSINNSPGYINGLLSPSHNRTLGNALSATFLIIDKFNATIRQGITVTKNQQAGAMHGSPTIKNYTSSFDATYNLNKHWKISSNFDYQKNVAVTNSSTASIWNATSSYRFMKEKAEIKLTAFDILRQNQNIFNFLNQNTIGTTVTNGLRQYFMVSFSFYPRKFGKKH